MKDTTRKVIKDLLIGLIIFAMLASFISLYSTPTDKVDVIDLSTLASQVNEGKIQSIEVDGDKVNITTVDSIKELVYKEQNESLSTLLKNYQVDPEKMRATKVTIKTVTGWDMFVKDIVPFLLPFLLIGAFLWFMMRSVQGANRKAMSFGQTQARQQDPNDKKNKITFKDVAGCKEAKNELDEIVDFLKHPKKFLNVGARIPKGVLLFGAPGTGKTMLAKAVAGEANVPFFIISGSEFVEMFVGVGASRVRDLFQRAKKFAPCIIFIDEIDAVGRMRGSGLGGSHDEREQTLNQILVEMDGFDTSTNVIVMAATNRPDVLDPALLRPGRFDRRIILDMPDINDREAILQVHAKNKPLAKDADLRKVAERTPGFSGADLFNLLNEAAILTARQNRKEVTDNDILQSIEKVMLGPERKSYILNDMEKKITAYHEAGHALIAHELHEDERVRKVSIIARGRAAGYTIQLPSEDRKLHPKSYFINNIAVMLGGFIAEKQTFGEVTTGATSDLQKATATAKDLATVFGMSDILGPRTFGKHEDMIFLGREIHENRDYSEKTAEVIDQEISKFIGQAYKKTEKILTDKKATLDKIVKVLLEKETIEQDEFQKICEE